MNPLAVLTALTAVWHFIPENRREKYVGRILDVVEDLGVEAVSVLRKKKDQEQEQMELDLEIDDSEEHF